MAVSIIRKLAQKDLFQQLDQLEQPIQVRSEFKSVATMDASFSKAKQSTGIEWTQATWNPMVGCSIHTAGCANCYAMKQAGIITSKHYEGVVKWVSKGNMRDSVWSGKINQSPPHILNKPRTIKAPSMIFVNSMSDFFHQDMDYRWQRDAMNVMAGTPRHVYQILTKRPENIMKFVEAYGKEFPRNVWVGATMERHDYTHRIDTLRNVPAYLKFLSIEPLVGHPGTLDLEGIGWVIIGGESGPGSREMKYEWLKSAVEQSVAQGVPTFFKQYGIKENNPVWKKYGDKGLREKDPIGKGGSLIDGVAWKQFPTKYEF